MLHQSGGHVQNESQGTAEHPPMKDAADSPPSDGASRQKISQKAKECSQGLGVTEVSALSMPEEIKV